MSAPVALHRGQRAEVADLPGDGLGDLHQHAGLLPQGREWHLDPMQHQQIGHGLDRVEHVVERRRELVDVLPVERRDERRVERGHDPMRQVVTLVLQVPDPLVLLGGVGQRVDEVRELARSDRDAVGGLLEEVVEEPLSRDHLEGHVGTVPTAVRRLSTGCVSRRTCSRDPAPSPGGRVVRIGSIFLPEALHVDVERLRVAEVVGSPDLLDQEVARQQATLADAGTSRAARTPSAGTDAASPPTTDLVADDIHLAPAHRSRTSSATPSGRTSRATQQRAHARDAAPGPRTASSRSRRRRAPDPRPCPPRSPWPSP